MPEDQLIVNTPKSSISVYIRVLIVFIVLAAAGTAFFFLRRPPITTPSKVVSKTNTWKTYTNAKFNFTIEYPSDLIVSEISGSNKNGASFSDAISIAAGKTLLNYVNQTLEEYTKIAGSETENRTSLASYKKVSTTNGIVGYKTTWMMQGRSMNGAPPSQGESESLPITYFEIPGTKTELIRVELLKKEYLETYEKMLKTVRIMAPLTPNPTIDETAVLKYVIKKYIASKRNKKEDSLIITVSKIEGNYAQGGISNDEGGGMWFASKEEGAWMPVWSGNGTIECSTFTLYPNFPTNMIPECYDSVKQDVVQR